MQSYNECLLEIIILELELKAHFISVQFLLAGPTMSLGVPLNYVTFLLSFSTVFFRQHRLVVISNLVICLTVLQSSLIIITIDW